MNSGMDLRFDNRFLSAFPGDRGPAHISRPTPGVAYVEVPPTPVREPELLAWSEEAGRLLDLARPTDPHGLEARVFAGNELLPGMKSYSTRYGGHQFGHWAGQLGDGRAISLGEAVNSRGERWEVQLKGAGLTPYSRHADGRAVLRSSLREFLCSEAMHFLGVPTTRALCCVLTGEKVVRDMFYDGHPEAEPGAITTRLAPTFIRFGHFEILAASGENELLKKLVQHTIQNHFPGFSPDDLYSWVREIAERTARLMVDWLRVGFVHGVMNTDNMSILGWTIDYGPYGWLDVYDPEWTPNTTDADTRRYRYGQQPEIALWNLIRLAEAISPLVGDMDRLAESVNAFHEEFSHAFTRMRARKIGLEDLSSQEDAYLIRDLDQALVAEEVDMTLFYRLLARAEKFTFEEVRPAYYAAEPSPLAMEAWLARYRSRMEGVADRRARMDAVNPYFVLRNYLVQEALDELATGGRSRLESLMRALKTPYEENEHTRPFFQRRPEWARQRPGCSALSCSS